MKKLNRINLQKLSQAELAKREGKSFERWQ